MRNTNDCDNIRSLSKTEKVAIPLSADRIKFSEHNFEALIESKLMINKKNLAKSVLFACELCNGPLVPSSACIICKKASSRTCLKCNLRKLTGTHLLCCYSILENQSKFNHGTEMMIF